MTNVTQTIYRLDGLNLRKLLLRISVGSLSPQQAEQLVGEANRPELRLFRVLIGVVVGLVFLGVGVLLLRFAVDTYVEKQAFTSRARQTTGTVVALNRHAVGNKRPTYAPLVNYQVARQTYQFEGLATSPAAYVVGQRVTVQYDPAWPGTGRLRSFIEEWLLGLIAGGVGCLLTTIGLWIVWVIGQTELGPARIPLQTLQQVFAQVASGQLSVEAAHHQLLPGKNYPHHPHPSPGKS